MHGQPSGKVTYRLPRLTVDVCWNWLSIVSTDAWKLVESAVCSGFQRVVNKSLLTSFLLPVAPFAAHCISLLSVCPSLQDPVTSFMEGGTVSLHPGHNAWHTFG